MSEGVGVPNQSAGHQLSIVGRRSGFEPRYVKDRLAKIVVWTGGLSVIGALLLIFVYLAVEVWPLFQRAQVEHRALIEWPDDGEQTRYLAAEEQGEIGLRVTSRGRLSFVDLFSGETRLEQGLPIGERSVSSVVPVDESRGLLAAALDDGSVLLFRHQYKQTFPNDERLITPVVSYPRGEVPMQFATEAPVRLVARLNDGVLLLVGSDARGAVQMKRFEQETSLFGEVTNKESPLQLLATEVDPDLLLIDPRLRWLYVIDSSSSDSEDSGGQIALYQLDRTGQAKLVGVEVVAGKVRDARHLAGGISVVVADAQGQVSQWFPARDEDGAWRLARVRDFSLKKELVPTAIGPELRRRGFAVGDDQGGVTLFYATSERRLIRSQLFEGPIDRVTFNPRAQVLLAEAGGRLSVNQVHNEHPEVSFSSLWGKVWYESYDSPDYIWQSSSASADFEPKFSLMPLSFGTLKAAFYAMLFATPLAVLAAIFTANFMTPAMRQPVKPTVELMAALPTVILGFLAGLWLAPFVENNLLGVFLTLFFLPLLFPLFGFLWVMSPQSFKKWVPEGWEAALILPVILVVVWLCFVLGQPLEAAFFAGNLPAWMDQNWGIGYDQRNALIVGIAMGIAVIPTIYSIAEDAIFGVPKHLSLGSLALGATPWQTLVGVVLPTASPGIFSAVMIGMGRAVGETMIVLMATGNTAVMDPSIFQGLRTLSANIAVEMPESEIGSTHFRLLFMAGLVLFIFTFAFNTLAEVVRQRLRRKYASI